MTLALFDFDGTITRSDSMIRFIIYAVGIRKFILGMIFLLPQLVLFKLKAISSQTAKEKCLAFFFSGWEYEHFKSVARAFSKAALPGIIRKSAMEKIAWHKQEGHRVIVVSASLESWLKPWCESQGIELICSRMQVVNDRVTGRLDGKNCNGFEKVRRISESVEVSLYAVHAYGNSRGDREMLSLAQYPNYRIFRD